MERIANWHLIAMLIAVSISMAVFLAVVGGRLAVIAGEKTHCLSLAYLENKRPGESFSGPI